MMLKAYAKVNLFLKVLGKREDGFHNLQMVNTTISLHDNIYIRKGSSNKITYSWDYLNNLDSDFILNMINYICDEYDIKDSFNIYIKKRIPVGGGLGGASSDAASILLYLNNKYKFAKDILELVSIGKKFSSDIPYFLYNSSAIVEGTGDIVTPIKFNYKKHFYIVNPGISVSTKESFKNLANYDLRSKNNELISQIECGNIEDILYNRLEESTFKLYPSLSDYKNNLSKYGDVIMSGSGSSFVVMNIRNFKNFKKSIPSSFIFKVKSVKNKNKL